MKYLLAVCLFVIATCTGCISEKYWYNEENSYLRARNDCRECLYQAQQQILEDAIQQNSDLELSLADNESNRQTIFEQCMQDRGYIQKWDWDIDFSIKKGSLLQNDELYNIAGK